MPVKLQTDSNLKRIIAGVKCQKDFICEKSGFKNLCKANHIKQGKYVECLDEKPKLCSFSLTFGDTFLCICPVRVHIAKEYDK